MSGGALPLPSPTVPVVDAGGKMKVDWYEYFRRAPNSLVTTVAGLPPAARAGAGFRAFVTDASATTFHSTVASGGSNKVPVVSDGTNWLIG